jgi:hypothetical protein
MGCNHTPALRRQHPGLTLAACSIAAFALKLKIIGRELVAIGGDDSLQYRSCQPLRRASRTKLANGLVAIKIFPGAVAQGVLTVTEQFIEYVDFVVHERLFIAITSLSHGKQDFWFIDMHGDQSRFGIELN